ncbi:MAG: IS66 family insertion sequence element accessory protein TnpB [Rhodobacteraceae bacterium]|nr:IS66 family insertion sequence element accessory protein TnpB [Paracoccaceae bacterium]
MIGPGTGVRVYLACGVTDMRKGIAGLTALTQDVLRQKPASGAVFALRGRRGDRIKLLYWDGQGFCLYYKVLERGRFPWPTATEGAARLTSAQLAMLWEGIGLCTSRGHIGHDKYTMSFCMQTAVSKPTLDVRV